MKVLDRVWMLVKENPTEVIYLASGSPSQVWEAVVESEMMGTGVTKEILKKRGFRAKKVAIVIEDTAP